MRSRPGQRPAAGKEGEDLASCRVLSACRICFYDHTPCPLEQLLELVEDQHRQLGLGLNMCVSLRHVGTVLPGTCLQTLAEWW